MLTCEQTVEVLRVLLFLCLVMVQLRREPCAYLGHTLADFDGLCCWPAICFNSSILGNSGTFAFGLRSVGTNVGQWCVRCVLTRAQNLGHNSGGHWLATCAVLYLRGVDPVAGMLLVDGGNMEQQMLHAPPLHSASCGMYSASHGLAPGWALPVHTASQCPEWRMRWHAAFHCPGHVAPMPLVEQQQWWHACCGKLAGVLTCVRRGAAAWAA